VSSPKEYNVLYRNKGDGTFADVTEQVGLKGQGWAGDAAIFDFDEDGHLDVLVTNMFGLTQLYKNLGNGTFTDATAETIKRTSWGAIGSKAFDYNNDGKLDLLLVDMHSDMWALPNNDHNFQAFVRKNESKRYPRVTGPKMDSEPVASDQEERFVDTFQIDYEKVVFGNTLFKNLGGGSFEEVGEKAGLESFWPWGIAAADFNNDGFEDVFVPSGMGYPYFYWPNRLFMNNGNGTFAERSHEEGIEPPRHGIYMDRRIGTKPAPRSSRCAAVADFRGLGRLDIVTNNFNDVPYYFQNKFPSKNYIAFELQGTKSNRDAVGALVRIYSGNEVQVRQMHPAGGYLSQSSRRIHFGLGEKMSIDRVEIRWPNGLVQQVEHPATNQLHKIVEPTE
jgi:enediyne biosynthesis protein E4